MTTQVTVTTEGLVSVIEDGDVLINFTSNSLPCTAAFVRCSSNGECSVATGEPTPVAVGLSVNAIQKLLIANISRFVLVSDGSQAAIDLANGLASAGISTASFVLAEDCAADSFMDEDDSEAVAERLRQLGYI